MMPQIATRMLKQMNKELKAQLAKEQKQKVGCDTRAARLSSRRFLGTDCVERLHMLGADC